MVDVFEQVEEELRSDRYSRLARTWLPVLGAVLALALIVALGWWGWQSWETRRAAAASVAYDRGMEQMAANNTAAADTAFTEAAGKGNGAYKSLALSQRAAIAVAANRIPDAIALFEEAAEASGDPLLSDPPALKAALLSMDTASLADVTERLEPLAEEGRPLRPFAQEALAMARLQHGQTAPARAAFVQLSLGQGVPDSMRQRAQAAIDVIDSGVAASLPGILRAQAAAAPAGRPSAAAPAQTPASPAPAAPAAQ